MLAAIGGDLRVSPAEGTSVQIVEPDEPAAEWYSEETFLHYAEHAEHIARFVEGLA